MELEIQIKILPLPLREGVGGGGPATPRPPPPNPLPQGEGEFSTFFGSLRSSFSRFSASCHPSSFCSPPSARRWTTPSPRSLPPPCHGHRGPRPPGPAARAASRARRRLALPCRHRTDAAHQSAHRGRGPALLVPPRCRSPRPGPRHRADLLTGHVVSGGSTLAMQAARLLEPRPRTLRSKLIEMARAVQLEAARPAGRARHLAHAGAVRRQPGGR